VLVEVGKGKTRRGYRNGRCVHWGAKKLQL
jgi:hypothetical protein